MSMATVYRDYGARSDQSYVDNYANVTPRTQVYQATHRGDGPNNRLPFMNRSFISFTYSNIDGPLVHIEDFNLIATIAGDRWERDGYTTFNDLTTNYDNLDGQYYWGTHYKSHSITFNLATDGIDQKMLDDFLNWFRAGVSRELILAEHPNRAQMARVQEPPQLSLLPFEGHTTMIVSDVERQITTTLYKGEITLTLVMDEPHWYAKDNILGKKITEEVATGIRTRYIDWWIDANGESVEIFASQDALKILYEDGIPLGSMIENNMLLGNKAYANVESQTESLIWSIPQDQIEIVYGELLVGEGARIDGTITERKYAENSREIFATENLDILTDENEEKIYADQADDFIPDYREYLPGVYTGKIAGAIVDVNGNGIPYLAPNVNGYFYYAGTAPSPTIISFEIMPHFNSSGYFDAINNSYTNISLPYNTITIESEHVQTLKLTTPNLITSYNKAVKILHERKFSDVIGLRKLIRDEIRHPIVRQWVSSLVSDATGINSISQVTANEIASSMQDMFRHSKTEEWLPMIFSFNSKTGEAIAEVEYREPTKPLRMKRKEYTENALNKITVLKTADPNLSYEQRYENIVTWEWDMYCKKVINGEWTTIAPGNEYTAEDAVRAFLNYYEYCLEQEVSMENIYIVHEAIIVTSNILKATENVGDMLKSNGIYLYDRNHPNEYGKIVHRTTAGEGRTYSHSIRHDFSQSLTNLQLVYKNMYL